MSDVLMLLSWPGPAVSSCQSKIEVPLPKLPWLCNNSYSHCHGLGRLETWGGEHSQPVLVGMIRVGWECWLCHCHRRNHRWASSLLCVLGD